MLTKILKLFLLYPLLSCLYASEIEVGIVLLPDKTCSDKCEMYANILKGHFHEEIYPNIHIKNKPHLSLYQLNIDDRDLEKVKNAIELVSQKYEKLAFVLDDKLVDTKENVFWCSQRAKTDQKLLALLSEVIDSVKLLRHKNLMRQLRDIPLDESDKILIEKYGVPFGVPERFNPHITILYNTFNLIKEEYLSFTKEPIEQEVKFDKIAVVQLGISGNIEKTLIEYKLF